jgi:phosphopantothenoylcysteine decarboxylase / phosphopantothenate---cysteine ligase
MRFLITAGPTREYLDDIRFLTNASSGKMGFAIAEAALERGHHVDLVTGPVSLEPPKGAKVHRVTTTQEMFDACAGLFPRAGCLIGAAAPADFTPARRVKGKAKKGSTSLTLQLKPTTDILATLGREKKRQLIIAFALEVQRPVTHARGKLISKNADAIVLNSPKTMGALTSDAIILLRRGPSINLCGASKRKLARLLIRLAEQLREGSD